MFDAVLGLTSDLHTGLHGALLWAPPADVVVAGFPAFQTSDDGLVRQRERTLLARFSSRRCAAIVFRMEFARTFALRHVEERRLANSETRVALEAKSSVVYPTFRASARGPKQERLRVLFSGRIDRTGGDIGLTAFAELLKDDAEFVCVASLRRALRFTMQWRSCLLERTSYLAELARANVFVGPTKFESYGMALVEAAAHGLAIVTTRGSSRRAKTCFASRRGGRSNDRARGVRDHVLRLARDRPTARGDLRAKPSARRARKAFSGAKNRRADGCVCTLCRPRPRSSRASADVTWHC